MKVNRWKDLAERVFWTFFQAFLATAVVTGFDNWETTCKIAGGAGLIAAVKVVAAQQIGDRGSGDAIPGGVEA